jgi:FlaA1/EpsC-like NDP-sugar epimerase
MRKVRDIILSHQFMHRTKIWTAQIGIFALAAVAAFLLRFDFSLPPAYVRHLAYALPIWILVKIVVFRVAKLDRGWWRYVSVVDLLRIIVGNLVASVLGCILILLIAPRGFPRSLYVLDLMICFLGTAGLRMMVRMTAEAAANAGNSAVQKNTLIYGAGAAGVTLLREIQNNPKLAYRVRGFLDDLPEKRGACIHGISVLGGGDDVKALVAGHSVETILIAISSATGAEMTRILQLCHTAGAECKTVPGLSEVIDDRGLAGQIRDVAVEDLLGRSPVRLEHAEISAKLSGRTVLVTGAAGSIGSELCRQIARFNPAGIIGFEMAETALFHIEQEMARVFPGVRFYPEIGSVQNLRRLTEVFERHHPSIVYHAAAYKHVPMMEAHVFEAIENNVLGTFNVAVAAAANAAEDFVMISSDKAVRPTNVMGATKRIAELVIRSLQNGGVNYVSVRFGNVIGSNGSVVPTFKEQIARGGPVTITHAEMRRYFMTIPEACQLVLQSSSMGKGGEIFVLDMGEPVKILDLARNLILLSGLRPDKDIKIAFTGMRPGEKLYEELNLSDESTLPTSHEKIKVFAGASLSADVMETCLEDLRDACERRDLPSVILLLKEMVPDYNPSGDLLRRALEPTPSVGLRALAAAIRTSPVPLRTASGLSVVK